MPASQMADHVVEPYRRESQAAGSPGRRLERRRHRDGHGMFQVGAGLFLYAQGSRSLPAAELTLLSLAEVLLGPLWVWLFMGETESIILSLEARFFWRQLRVMRCQASVANLRQ